jgi:hypothetical protein
MKHLPLRECGYAIAFIAGACILYGGAYVALLQREVLALAADGQEMTSVSYGFGDEGAEWFFAPAHAIDAKLRPALWSHDFDPAFIRFLSRDREPLKTHAAAGP